MNYPKYLKFSDALLIYAFSLNKIFSAAEDIDCPQKLSLSDPILCKRMGIDLK